MIARLVSILSAWFALMSVSLAPALAQDANPEATPQVEARVWISTPKPFIMGQKVDLNIEIAASARLERGVNIGAVEIEDAIVRQRQKFATNSTREKDGRSWTVQLWSAAIYPTASGTLLVPQIPISIYLAPTQDQRQKALSSKVHTIVTDPLQFAVSLPGALRGLTTWIASDDVQITDDFDQPLEGLKVGDAITRTIRVRANSVPAMMLPRLNVLATKGLSVHAGVPKLIDRENRGQLVGERRETLTYVVEKKGNYVLPEHRFAWWDTGARQLRWIVLPEHRIDARGRGTIWSSFPSWSVGLALFVLLLLCVSVLLLSSGKIGAPVGGAWSTYRDRQWYIRLKLVRALRRDDHKHSLELLYRWLEFNEPTSSQNTLRDFARETNSPAFLRAFNGFMARHYGQDTSSGVDPKETLNDLAHSIRRERVHSRKPKPGPGPLN